MAAQNIKLIVYDPGDPSVGIFASTWEIPYPNLMDIQALDESDWDELNNFRQRMIEAYTQLCDSKCRADYDFELIEEREFEKYLDDQIKEIRERENLS